MKYRSLIFTIAASCIAFSCNGPAQSGAEVSSKILDAPVGCRSYYDVYGPVKSIEYNSADKDHSVIEFDEKGMAMEMLERDREYLELNGLPENESTIKVDGDGRLASFGIAGFNELKYEGIYVTEEIEHPTDLGPASSPYYYVYDNSGNRVARFHVRIELTPQLTENYKDHPEYMVCDESILDCQVERYEIIKSDSHGNWIERKTICNQSTPEQNTSMIEKRTITYYE